MPSPRLISLGEAVMDLFATPTGATLQDASSFVPRPGGAPFNVAIAAARMGLEAAFIGKVGDDPFGAMLIEFLESEHVDTRYCNKLSGAPTMLALVASASPNQQSFVVYHGADRRLEKADLDRRFITDADAFMYGSVTLADVARDAALQAASWAKTSNTLVGFDANYRPSLWPSLDTARDGILEGLRTADVCKLNLLELQLLTGTDDLEIGSRWVLKRGPRLCVVTLGAEGAYFNNCIACGHVPAFKVEEVDTTGCGDAFIAALMVRLIKNGCENPGKLSETELREFVSFANAAGALTATHHGATAALPHIAAIEAFIVKEVV